MLVLNRAFVYFLLAGLYWAFSGCSAARPDMSERVEQAPAQPTPVPIPPGPRVDLSGATYVGSDQCARCGHEAIHKDWANSLHNKMIQKARPEIILGDFNNRTMEREGWHFRMYKEGGKYLIDEVLPDGTKTVYQVDYTLGSKRIQHYLSVRPDKSMRVTFPTWDVLKHEWIHGSEIVRGAHNSTGELIALPIQIWNKHCWNCHTSQEEEGFNIATETFHTTFTEPGINCEMCHGPGSLHIQRMERDPADKNMATVNVLRFLPEERMNDCLQCHTRRIMVKKGYQVGENFYDYYQLKLVDLSFQPSGGPPVWADKARRFANECILLWESQCFVKGNATCVSCHDEHQIDIARDPRYKNTDVLCTQCHKEYLDRKLASEHTRHPLTSPASRCVECHMLKITKRDIKLLQNAEIRDHLVNVPIPENTAKYGIPNACNNACHEDKPVEWVIEWMDKWYPKRPKASPVEDALDAARHRSPEAIPRLIGIAQDVSRGTIVRASAVSFLGEFRGETVAEALIKALGDPNVVVRAEAARALSEVQSPASIEPLKEQLSNPVRIVRLNAVFALIKMGILQLNDSYSEAYQKARQEYIDFLKEFPTVFETRVDLGTFLAVQGKYEEALTEYMNARKLRPESPMAHYYIGVTYAQLGLLDEALASLDEVLKLDPNFRNTRELIERIKEVKSRP